MSTLDENGILQYDETDTRGTFSELLNMGQDATSDAIGADRARLSVLESAAALDAPTSGFITPASGWTISNVNGRKKNGIAFINALFTRTGPAIPVPADGNVSNTLLGTLNPGWFRASSLNISLWHDGFTGPMTTGYINASNELNLGAISPAASIGTGQTIGLNAIYPLA